MQPSALHGKAAPESSLEPECNTDRKPAPGLPCSTCPTPVMGSEAWLSSQQPCKELTRKVPVLLWQMRKLRQGLTELLHSPSTELGMRPELFELRKQLSFHSRPNQPEDADRRPVPEPRWRQRSREGAWPAGGSCLGPSAALGLSPPGGARRWPGRGRVALSVALPGTGLGSASPPAFWRLAQPLFLYCLQIRNPLLPLPR